MIVERLKKLEKDAVELSIELKSLEDILTAQEIENIKIAPTADRYTGCQYCKHASDTEEICILRRCKHAIHSLNECFHKR